LAVGVEADHRTAPEPLHRAHLVLGQWAQRHVPSLAGEQDQGVGIGHARMESAELAERLLGDLGAGRAGEAYLRPLAHGAVLHKRAGAGQRGQGGPQHAVAVALDLQRILRDAHVGVELEAQVVLVEVERGHVVDGVPPFALALRHRLFGAPRHPAAARHPVQHNALAVEGQHDPALAADLARGEHEGLGEPDVVPGQAPKIAASRPSSLCNPRTICSSSVVRPVAMTSTGPRSKLARAQRPAAAASSWEVRPSSSASRIRNAAGSRSHRRATIERSRTWSPPSAPAELVPQISPAELAPKTSIRASRKTRPISASSCVIEANTIASVGANPSARRSVTWRARLSTLSATSGRAFTPPPRARRLRARATGDRGARP